MDARLKRILIEMRMLEAVLLLLSFLSGFLVGYLAHYLFGDFL